MMKKRIVLAITTAIVMSAVLLASCDLFDMLNPALMAAKAVQAEVDNIKGNADKLVQSPMLGTTEANFADYKHDLTKETIKIVSRKLNDETSATGLIKLTDDLVKEAKKSHKNAAIAAAEKIQTAVAINFSNTEGAWAKAEILRIAFDKFHAIFSPMYIGISEFTERADDLKDAVDALKTLADAAVEAAK